MKANSNKQMNSDLPFIVIFAIIMIFALLLLVAYFFTETGSFDIKERVLRKEIVGVITEKERYRRETYIEIYNEIDSKKEMISLSGFSSEFFHTVQAGDSIYSKSGENKITIHRGDSVFVIKKVDN